MKKSKAFLALALTLSVGTSILAGCAPKKPVAAPAPTTPAAQTGELKPEDGAELKFWMDNDDYNTKIIEAFNKKYPNVKVTAENVGTTDTRAKLELAGPTGQGADVFIQPHDGVAAAAQAGLTLELGQFADEIKADNLPNAVEAGMYQGKLYGLPITIKTYALFYNKKLVEKPVETWEEMAAFAKSYNDPSKNKFALYWQANEPYFAHMALSAKGYEMFGPKHDDKTKLGWTTPEAIEGMKFYKTLKDIYPIPAQDATYDAMNNNFSEGKAPYVITGPWSIKGFKDKGVDFEVVALPTVGGKHPVSLSTVDTVNVSSFTKFPNAAKLFAKFLLSEEGIKILYETRGELPTNKKLQEADFIKADVHLAGIAKQAQYAMPMPFIPEMANVWDPYKKAFTAVWDGLQEPEAALKAAQEEFETAIVKK
jgi:arabinogalactan oligomer/maltooligosaccharide transport system substrate-binding protein